MNNLGFGNKGNTFSITSVSKNKSLIMVIYLLLLLGLIIILPLYQYKYIHTWSPSATENKLYIPLVERTPESVLVNLPCNTLKGDTYDWILEFKGGTAFQIFKDQKIGILVGNSSRSESKIYYFDKIESEDSSCNVEVKYTKSTHSVQVSNADFTSTSNLEADLKVEILNNVLINENYADKGISLIIETIPPSDVSETPIRNIIHMNFLIVLIFSISLFVRRFKSSEFKKNLYFLITDKYFYFVTLTLLVLNAVLPQNMDDGWRITESSLLRETGIYNNYIVPSPLPTGRLLALINSVFLSTNSFYLMRLPSVFAIALIWLVSVLTINKLFEGKLNLVLVKKYVSFLVILFSSAFLIGLRAEVYIALLLSLSILVIVYEKQLTKISTFQLLLTFSGLSLAIHQSGLSIAAVCLLYGLLNFKDLFRLPFILNPILLIAISSIGLAIFYTNNAYSIFQSLRIYSSKFDEARIFGDVATLNPLMELERFLNIFSYKHGLFTFASLLLFLSIIFLTYLLINRIIPNSERRLVIFILCSFLAIFLMPSKWAWYYMVYLPLPILGLFFFIVYLNKIKVTIWLTLLTLLTLVSVRNQNLEYNLAPIVNVNLNNFFEVYTLIFQVSAFFLFLFLLVFIVRLLGRFSYISTSLRLFQTLNLLIVSSFLILLGYKITPLLLDSQTNNRWSFIKQNILFNSPNSCGLFSEFGVQYKTVMNSLDDYPYAPCFKPLLFNYGVWDYPEIIFQSFNILDQQRLGYEIKIESSTCINDYSNRYEEICIYRTAKNIVNSSVKSDVKYPQY
jgi:hypothetical protein